MGFLTNVVLPALEAVDQMGLVAIGAGLCACTGTFSAVGEALICSHAIDGIARNPEMYGKLRSTMILAVALDESTGIYALIVAIHTIFALPSMF